MGYWLTHGLFVVSIKGVTFNSRRD